MMLHTKTRVSSGHTSLDRLLGGLFIGDNVLWYDTAGSLAMPFCMKLIETSLAQNKPLIYVSVDRSPKNLLEFLGPLAKSKYFTVLDCFTQGKGDGSEVFEKFYEKDGAQWPYQIIRVNEPTNPESFIETIYGLHKTLEGDVRFVFESLTGLQDLWGGEESIIRFYSHSCPRLYELNTIAYWILEKNAHSDRLKAHINQIAQVAIDLSVKEDKSSISILKAEGRNPSGLNKPTVFTNKGMDIEFSESGPSRTLQNIGMRLKTLRKKQGLTQTKLAGLVDVTPSTISQVECNLIYPSLPALIKIAEALAVDINYFFQANNSTDKQLVYTSDKSMTVTFPDLPGGSVHGKLLIPVDVNPAAEPYMIEIPPGKKLPMHFFTHKGEEVGYLLSGELKLSTGKSTQEVGAGDVIFLKNDIPAEWENPGQEPARLLWFKVNS